MVTVSKSGFVLTLAAIAVFNAQIQIDTPIREQTVFREDEPFHHSIPLPPNVLRVLMQTKEVEEALDSASEEQQDNPSQLFHATDIHLSRPDEIDLIAQGVSPLSGADNSWFWVISSTGNIPRVILWTGCNSLEVMGSKTNGYRNIRSRWSSSSVTQTREYHFNGEKYVLWKQTESKNRY